MLNVILVQTDAVLSNSETSVYLTNVAFISLQTQHEHHYGKQKDDTGLRKWLNTDH